MSRTEDPAIPVSPVGLEALSSNKWPAIKGCGDSILRRAPTLHYYVLAQFYQNMESLIDWISRSSLAEGMPPISL